MDDGIVISKKEYLSLLLDSEKLRRLENAGVDNWSFYGESLNLDEDDLETFELEEKERISKL